MADSDYDLFISYADADRPWVDGFLIPASGLARERIITRQDFRPGPSILSEFERAITCSRFTLIIFSPAYLVDSWSTFGEQLAGYASVSEHIETLIPLVLTACDLPLRINFRVQMDCTDNANWQNEISRLRALLQQPEPKPETIPCPYPGILPFEAGDAQHFFGREDEVDELIARLRYQRFLMIIGPSGSGKSSMIFAGLLPQLQKVQPERWAFRSLRLGDEPMAALKEAAQALLESEQPRETSSPRPLLVIDQFEELFALPSRKEQAAVIETIQALRRQGVLTLMLIMRADFYGDLINSVLWEVPPEQRFEVAPLREAALRKAIQLPAASVGVYLESALVEQLLDDAAGEPGALPLMQETLALLWEQRVQRLLSSSAYQKLGAGQQNGLSRAIAIMADAVYADLNPAQQGIARRIFLRLIQFGEGRADTRRQLPVQALVDKDAAADTQSVLQYLTKNRLLTLSGDAGIGDAGIGDAGIGDAGIVEARVDLAHEALISSWPRLQDWIADYRKAELTRRRLQSQAEEWQRMERRGGLLDPIELEAARAWVASPDAQVLGVDEAIQEFIKASSQAQQVRQRSQWLVPLAAALGVMLLAAVGWLGYVTVLRARANSFNPTIHIPGGTALIGDESNPSPLTGPLFEVRLPAFDLQSYEVSNDQYCLCVKSRGCSDSLPYKEHTVCDAEIARLPVTNVTLNQANQFCAWSGGRLPTEMEWEWAARGSEGRLYPIGNQEPVPGEINLRDVKEPPKAVWPVDRMEKDITPGYDPASRLAGMTGNVREWTLSWYAAYDLDGYRTTYWPDVLPAANGNAAVRGGSYLLTPVSAMSSSRTNTETDQQLPDLGFRCLFNLSLDALRKEVITNQ